MNKNKTFLLLIFIDLPYLCDNFKNDEGITPVTGKSTVNTDSVYIFIHCLLKTSGGKSECYSDCTLRKKKKHTHVTAS